MNNRIHDLEAANRRTVPDVECAYCVKDDKNQARNGKNPEQEFESPLLALRPFLVAFQYLGIFNFSIYEKYTEFACKPNRLVYSIGLNIILIGIPVGLNFLWLRTSQVGSYDELTNTMAQIFSKTDFVALASFIMLLQVASLGLHINNMGLCHHLNDMVSNVRQLGVIEYVNRGLMSRGHDALNPSAKKLFRGVGLIFLMMMTSMFMIGFSFPSIIGGAMETSVRLQVLLGLTESVAITYLHLPQILSEILFLRVVNVLEFHYEHLLGHIDCCFLHKRGIKTMKDTHADCCLTHCTGLLQLFTSIEQTFCRQLFIQFALIMGSLIFGIYLSVSFLITSNMFSDYWHLMFTLGYMIYSLVPAMRLMVTATSVNKVMVKMEETRQRLYEMEATVRGPDAVARVRWTIRRYTRIDGFSACNFFVINHKLVTSIAGYLTTYIIVLVQFKITDLSF